MKKILNYIYILSVALLGLLVTSCSKSELPFPETPRATFVTLSREAGPGVLTDASDASTVLTIGVKLNKFGGTEYQKVEVCVVRNPTASNYSTAVLGTITSGLSIENPTNITVTAADLVSLTNGTPISSGENFIIYYNLYMPDGTYTLGWSKPTGFTNDKSLANNSGQVGKITYSAVCGLTFADFLGNWNLDDPDFADDNWDCVATEDPSNPGKGLLLTFSTPSNEYGDITPKNPLKVVIDLETYTFVYPSNQIWWDNMANWGPGWAGYTNYQIGGGSGNIVSCGTITMQWTSGRLISQGSFGNFTTTLTKLP
jgi:hypothetical protein